jgi:hypothetical protein
MKIIIGILIFCLVLFVYLHIQFHLKTSEDLEMYEIDNASKNKLEEICDIRQPILFDFDNQVIIDNTNKQYITDNYHAFEIKIRNINDDDSNSELYIPLPLHSSVKLFNEDKQSLYYSENNSDFLEETGIVKTMKYNDEFLRPYMVSNCNYDILMGSNGTTTPFRYKLNYRNYFVLTQGSAQIKLAPPHSTKYLYPNYDYENFEFKSPINPWNPQPKYVADFSKIKCLEFTLLPGKTLFLPAYWWYSIKFDNNTSISCFHYRTYMNNLAIIPYFALHALQLQNVKRDVAKKIQKDSIQDKDNVLLPSSPTPTPSIEPKVPNTTSSQYDNQTTAITTPRSTTAFISSNSDMAPNTSVSTSIIEQTSSIDQLPTSISTTTTTIPPI